ncbi:MAG: hypothetical protein KBC15_01015 [Candidatus Levybacteria bacterium]|nr:hypothetical protein [Candidatus Levybacteria bacterium]
MTASVMTLSESGHQTLALAKEEAALLHHGYIGTEHLLLGLVRAEGTTAAQVLANMGIQLQKVRSAVEFIVGKGEGNSQDEPALTVRSKRALELAMQEARQLDSPCVHSEHILLGLFREGEGIGVGVLESLGVRLEKIRPQLMRALASGLMLSENELQEIEGVVANLTLFEQLLGLNVPATCVSILNAHLTWEPEKLTIAGTQPEIFEIFQSMFRRAVQPFRDANDVCLGFVSLHAVATNKINLEHGKVCPFCSTMINAIKQAHLSLQTS